MRARISGSGYWLCIDPGISGTGYALFQGRKVVTYGNVYPDKDYQTWEQRSSSIHLGLMFELPWNKRPSRVYIEWPAQFTGRRGLAATNSNDILKLACLIGRLSQYFISRDAMVILVPVQRWKGNLPKEVVAKRAKEFFKLRDVKSHAADALGLGRFVIKEIGHETK